MQTELFLRGTVDELNTIVTKHTAKLLSRQHGSNIYHIRVEHPESVSVKKHKTIIRIINKLRIHT